MDKDTIMFAAAAVDAMPSQSTQGMVLKAKTLVWLSEQLEELAKQDTVEE